LYAIRGNRKGRCEKMNEDDFRDRFVKELKERKVPIINLKSGTLDAFLEDQCRFIEFKRVHIGGPRQHIKSRGIRFGRRQTRVIRSMKKKPYVIAFESDNPERCYLYSPVQVEKEFEKREDYPQVGFWEQDNYNPFSEDHCKPLTYNELLTIFTVR
jgi:hypothetical protein